MKASLRLPQGVTLQVQAIAGEVFLQIISGPGTVRPVTTARLRPQDAGAFLDMLAGVACIAEEQAFDLDLAVAMAASGHAPPRDLASIAEYSGIGRG